MENNMPENLKLYFCQATAIDDDPIGIIVAECAEAAADQFKKQLDDEGTYHTGTISAGLIQVDGYTITVEKNIDRRSIQAEEQQLNILLR